jgi:guanine nucleotide-binding protein G(i) subunit alpha
MGCAQSHGVDDEAKARKFTVLYKLIPGSLALGNDEIESQLKRDRLMAKNEIKMLLLGAGESGKSTVLKQMKLIHHGGYNDSERDSYKEIIFSNTIQSMRYVLLCITLDTANLTLKCDFGGNANARLVSSATE